MTTRLVTGACGCIGAWVVRELLDRGESVVALDLSLQRHRLDAVLGPDRFQEITFIEADVVDPQSVRRALADSGAEGIIHLAGMQVPSCRADPVRGAMVNIIGTLNVLEAARDVGPMRVVYASSAAVHGPPDQDAAGPCREHDSLDARTHYGVFKHANEGAARVMWHDHGVASVGLRPFTVYGVGRDFGLTSGPTTAIKSALLGRPFTIGFTGETDFQFVRDVAQIFVRALTDIPDGAHVCNIHGDATSVQHVIDVIDGILPQEHRGLIDCDGPALPMPGALCDETLAGLLEDVPGTALAQGLNETYLAFRDLHERGLLDTRDLPEKVAP